MERSNKKLQTFLLFVVFAFVAFVAYLNFSSTLSNGTHLEKFTTDKVEDTIDTAENTSEVSSTECQEAKEQDADLDKLLPSATTFKDEIYGDLVWQAKTYAQPAQHMLDAIENNYIEPSEKTLLIAVVNHGMLEYILNWIESLRRSEITKYLVFAIDQELVDAMTELGLGDHVVLIPDDWRHVQLSGDFAKWKSNDYTPITHAKTLIVERLLYLDVTVWFSDVDIVFTSPHIYSHLMWNLRSRKNVDMVFSQETVQTSINSGFYVMRPTETSKRVIGRTIDIQDRIPKLTQQRVMNRVLGGMNQDYRQSPMILLDEMLFPNGHFYFDAKLPTKLGFEPMMVHANYRYVLVRELSFSF
jgi:molybdopterin converting factor small subunit